MPIVQAPFQPDVCNWDPKGRHRCCPTPRYARQVNASYSPSFCPLPYHKNVLLAVTLLLRPHVDDFQRRRWKFYYMPWAQCLCVYVFYTVRMENSRLSAVENRLFARRICQSKHSPTISLVSLKFLFSLRLARERSGTYEGSLEGAQTIAILSGIIT
jgi:hypothetical protein